jgi:hypothetical protein
MMYMLLPCTDKSVISTIKKNKDRPMQYSSYVKSQIITEAKILLEKEAVTHKTLENLRRNLGLFSEYDFKAAYLESIEINGIEIFLKSTENCSVSEELYSAILRRIDSAGEGEISYDDFRSFLTPLTAQKSKIMNS